MTVEELRDLLEDQPGDAEVRLAMQPRWAFEYSITGVAGPAEQQDFLTAELALTYEDEMEAHPVVKNVVYIGEGTQLGYLPHSGNAAFEPN